MGDTTTRQKITTNNEIRVSSHRIITTIWLARVSLSHPLYLLAHTHIHLYMCVCVSTIIWADLGRSYSPIYLIFLMSQCDLLFLSSHVFILHSFFRSIQYIAVFVGVCVSVNKYNSCRLSREKILFFFWGGGM